MISVHFQGKPFNITVIQVYAPTSNAEEDEVERFYEDLSRVEAKNPALLSNRDGYLLELTGWTQGSQAS